MRGGRRSVHAVVHRSATQVSPGQRRSHDAESPGAEANKRPFATIVLGRQGTTPAAGAPPPADFRRRSRRQQPARHRLHQQDRHRRSVGRGGDRRQPQRRTVMEEGQAGPANFLGPGPVGEYLEVVDVDPASDGLSAVDLNDPYLLAQNGLAPSEGNPQFHQQMVYAVAMRTIEASSRRSAARALWARKRFESEETTVDREIGEEVPDGVRAAAAHLPARAAAGQRLLQPRQGRAAVRLFSRACASDAGDEAPGGMVFTCLSHDIVAHETTHALLDGLHRRYQEASNVDVPGVPRGVRRHRRDVPALHVSECCAIEIARTRGDLRTGNFLADLAQQFGAGARTARAALRSAIGVEAGGRPTTPARRSRTSAGRSWCRGLRRVPDDLPAPHRRPAAHRHRRHRRAAAGRPASGPGRRLAREAQQAAPRTCCTSASARSTTARRSTSPSADYLRALITADADLVGVDKYGYRVAFLEAFRRRGIYPDDVRTLSVESLRWSPPQQAAATASANSCAIPTSSSFRQNLGDKSLNFDWRGTATAGGL